MSTATGPRARLAAIRFDPEPLDRGWRPPLRTDRQWSGSQKFLVVIALLLLLAGSISTAGGFARRTDRVKSYAAGQQVDVGPMTITFDRVELTFTPKNRYRENDVDKWSVTAYGRATSKEQEPLQLSLDPGVVLTADGRPQKAKLRFGSGAGDLALPPGLAGVPVTVTQTLPRGWQPTGLLQVGVWKQQLGTDQLALADDRKTWVDTEEAIVFWCPVTRMPDSEF